MRMHSQSIPISAKQESLIRILPRNNLKLIGAITVDEHRYLCIFVVFGDKFVRTMIFMCQMTSKCIEHFFTAAADTFFAWPAFAWACASIPSSRVDKTICEYIATVLATV